MPPRAKRTLNSMPKKVLIDAGPVVAFLRGAEGHHTWAVEQFKRFPVFSTCQAVLAEACARLSYYGEDQSRVIDFRKVIDQSWRVGRACPQRAAAHRQSQPGALRTGAPYLPLSLRHY